MTASLLLAAVLAATSAFGALEASDASLPVKLEFVEAKGVEYSTKVYGPGAISRPRTIARRYAMRLSLRVSNGSSDALRSITLEGAYLDAVGTVVRRTSRQLSIEPPVQPGEARVIEFEDEFGAESPAAVKGFVAEVVDMNFAPETIAIIADGKLYAEPRAEARVDLELRKGTKLERLNFWREWYQVKAPTGEIGWIHTSLLPLAVFVDGRQVAFEAPPEEAEDGTLTVLLVPLAKALGAEAQWHEETESLVISKAETQLVLKQGSTDAVLTREGREPMALRLPQPLLVRKGKSYIDLEWLCRRLGAAVTYDPAMRAVNINTRPAPPKPGAIKQARAPMGVHLPPTTSCIAT